LNLKENITPSIIFNAQVTVMVTFLDGEYSLENSKGKMQLKRLLANHYRLWDLVTIIILGDFVAMIHTLC